MSCAEPDSRPLAPEKPCENRSYFLASIVMKPKAAIAYLAPPQQMSRNTMLYHSLECLEKNFNRRYHYPVVIFHEDLPAREIQKIKQVYSSPFIFVHLPHFQELPSNVTKDEVNDWAFGKNGGRHAQRYIGYRQMCRFFSYQLFSHPIMLEYDYYWRFDDDSFLLQPVGFDPFQVMADNGYVYGYRSLMREDPKKEEGKGLRELFQITRQFAKKHCLSTRYFRPFTDWRGRSNGKQYYTNFEITNISFWRNHPLFSQYVEVLEKEKGFYKFRWGDSIFRALTCALFLKPHQIHHFGAISYRHNTHYSLPGSTDLHYYLPSEEELKQAKAGHFALPLDPPNSFHFI